MDNELNNNVIQGDKYYLHIPIEKSISVDENGDYIVQGVMTSDATDEEDDSITPDGMDCSYFLEKGWVKYEHGKNPNQFIGEPLEVKVGQFKHPTLKKAVNGIYVKARLFSQRELTKQAIEAINDLEKSATKRRMGWSIEGNVVKRHPKTGKIIKSILRNVVLTMNPVNTTTWAELAKSFAKDHELLIDTDEPMDKSMDIETAQAVIPQSLEGADKQKKDPQQEWIDLFRSTVKKALVEKSFRNEFVRSPDDAENLAFAEALFKGLDYDEAEGFGSYVADKHPILKSLVINFGGDNMSETAKNTLSSLLDADLEELQKAINADNEDEGQAEDEELEKSVGEDDDELEKSVNEEGDDSEEPAGDEGDGSEAEDSDEDGEDGTEKSFRTDLTKSLSAEYGQALEVSDFLTSLTDEIGFSMEGMEKSIMGVTKQNNSIVKVLGSFGEVMQKALETIDSLKEDNAELQKSLNDILQRPVGRKGVVNQREVQTLSKSLDGVASKRTLNKSQITDELMKSFEAGEIAGTVITRFEGGVPLTQLGLPDHLQKSFGLKA